MPDGPAPRRADGTPGVRFKVVEAKADSLAEDPEIAWKNLSSTATLSYGAAQTQTASSHGPKVIPPTGGFETARYGDRPFPVVPVDFRDRKHDAPASTATKLAGQDQRPRQPGLDVQPLPGDLLRAAVPARDGADRDASTPPPGARRPFAFTKPRRRSARRNSNATLPARGLQDRQPRSTSGWYQLPGDTQYYGLDGKGSALIGALTGVGALQDIDSGCGPTGKAVFDAAQIADPEIDYDRFDTDKDGVVDFFMMVFPGIGGNGDSQLNGRPPYDNIWPHSSDLQNGYTDADGEKGYVSDDQSHDLEGRPLFWTDAGRSDKTTSDTGIPVYTRVGPYNVNPESAIEHASVISHEYGHSLGLPDYYSTGSRETYGAWTLMATDYSQNIDVVGKKELGWLVPRVLEPGQARRGHQLAGHQARHRPDRLEAPRRDALHADRRPASTTARRYVGHAPRAPADRPRARAERLAPVLDAAPATTSAARPPAATTSTSRCRPIPAGHAEARR